MAERGNPDREATSDEAAVAKERDDYLELLRRTRADFENYQKRAQRELAEERLHAPATLARELLPVVDSLEWVLAAGREGAGEEALVEGVRIAKSQMLDTFRRFGITPVNPEGKPFDPMEHEAVRQDPSEAVPHGTVLKVFEPGYRFHGRVFRPARVSVSTSEKQA